VKESSIPKDEDMIDPRVKVVEGKMQKEGLEKIICNPSRRL
jgi:hypothetical protein